MKDGCGCLGCLIYIIFIVLALKAVLFLIGM